MSKGHKTQSPAPVKRWSLDVYEKEVEALEKNELKITHVTNESVGSTRRMLQLVDECQDAGVNTLRMLNEQGESLNRTEAGLEDVHVDLKDAEKTLKRISFMEKVPCLLLPCYICCCKRKAPSRPRAKNADSELPSGPDINMNYPVDNKKSGKGGKKGKQAQVEEGGRFFNPITGEPEEEEVEHNLNVISRHIRELKEHAHQMGSTVTTQNFQIGRIHNKAELADQKIKHVTNLTIRQLGTERQRSYGDLSGMGGFGGGATRCLRCVIV